MFGIPYAKESVHETYTCDVCGEELMTPYYNCDGRYICKKCGKDAIQDTRKSPEWFVDWLEFQIDDFLDFELPNEG